MSLNSQIFSLRQAIIKAKRKAKQEQSSQSQCQKDQQCSKDQVQQQQVQQEGLPMDQSQESINQHTQTDRICSKTKNNIKSQEKQQKKQTSSKSKQSIYDSQINTIAKSLYSSRKLKLQQSIKSSNQKSQKSGSKQTNLQGSYKKSQLKEAGQVKETVINIKQRQWTQSNQQSRNLSPLVYSNTRRMINGEDSRVSTFTIGSQISQGSQVSKKSKVNEKLQKLRNIKLGNMQIQRSMVVNVQNQDRINNNFNLSVSEHENQNLTSYIRFHNGQPQKQFPDYCVSQKQLGITSLIKRLRLEQKLVASRSNIRKQFQNSKKTKLLNQKTQGKQHILTQIREWKNLRKATQFSLCLKHAQNLIPSV